MGVHPHRNPQMWITKLLPRPLWPSVAFGLFRGSARPGRIRANEFAKVAPLSQSPVHYPQAWGLCGQMVISARQRTVWISATLILRYEAHIPAQRSQACEEARISPPHGDACWSRHHQGTPPPRPREAVRLIGRVQSKTTFAQLRSSGTRASSGTVRITYVDGLDRPCVAFAIGRKIGGAVVRNRLRRRLRAICGELSGELASGAYLFSVSLEAVNVPYGELKADVKAALEKINERKP